MSRLIQIIWRKKIFPRMPLITSHLHTNANHTNQNEVPHDKAPTDYPRI